MDLCMQDQRHKQEMNSKPMSFATKDASTQATNDLPNVISSNERGIIELSNTEIDPKISSETRSMIGLGQKDKDNQPRDVYVTIETQNRAIKTTAKKGKIVKIIEREYELDRDSFEVSELIQHIPSRITNLAHPIEKYLKFVSASEDINQFDTQHFSPLNVEIFDEHVSELERRKITTRIMKGLEFPVFRHHYQSSQKMVPTSMKKSTKSFNN